MKTCTQCGHEIEESVFQDIQAKRLEWGKCSEREMDWHEAVKWCKEQGEGWRLPTRVELIQAYDEKVEGFVGSYFWSSTEVYNSQANAWVVVLDYGATFNSAKSNSLYIRGVRP